MSTTSAGSSSQFQSVTTLLRVRPLSSEEKEESSRCAVVMDSATSGVPHTTLLPPLAGSHGRGTLRTETDHQQWLYSDGGAHSTASTDSIAAELVRAAAMGEAHSGAVVYGGRRSGKSAWVFGPEAVGAQQAQPQGAQGLAQGQQAASHQGQQQQQQQQHQQQQQGAERGLLEAVAARLLEAAVAAEKAASSRDKGMFGTAPVKRKPVAGVFLSLYSTHCELLRDLLDADAAVPGGRVGSVSALLISSMEDFETVVRLALQRRALEATDWAEDTSQTSVFATLTLLAPSPVIPGKVTISRVTIADLAAVAPPSVVPLPTTDDPQNSLGVIYLNPQGGAAATSAAAASAAPPGGTGKKAAADPALPALQAFASLKPAPGTLEPGRDAAFGMAAVHRCFAALHRKHVQGQVRRLWPVPADPRMLHVDFDVSLVSALLEPLLSGGARVWVCGMLGPTDAYFEASVRTMIDVSRLRGLAVWPKLAVAVAPKDRIEECRHTESLAASGASLPVPRGSFTLHDITVLSKGLKEHTDARLAWVRGAVAYLQSRGVYLGHTALSRGALMVLLHPDALLSKRVIYRLPATVEEVEIGAGSAADVRFLAVAGIRERHCRLARGPAQDGGPPRVTVTTLADDAAVTVNGTNLPPGKSTVLSTNNRVVMGSRVALVFLDPAVSGISNVHELASSDVALLEVKKRRALEIRGGRDGSSNLVPVEDLVYAQDATSRINAALATLGRAISVEAVPVTSGKAYARKTHLRFCFTNPELGLAWSWSLEKMRSRLPAVMAYFRVCVTGGAASAITDPALDPLYDPPAPSLVGTANFHASGIKYLVESLATKCPVTTTDDDTGVSAEVAYLSAAFYPALIAAPVAPVSVAARDPASISAIVADDQLRAGQSLCCLVQVPRVSGLPEDHCANPVVRLTGGILGAEALVSDPGRATHHGSACELRFERELLVDHVGPSFLAAVERPIRADVFAVRRDRAPFTRSLKPPTAVPAIPGIAKGDHPKNSSRLAVGPDEDEDHARHAAKPAAVIPGSSKDLAHVATEEHVAESKNDDADEHEHSLETKEAEAHAEDNAAPSDNIINNDDNDDSKNIDEENENNGGEGSPRDRSALTRADSLAGGGDAHDASTASLIGPAGDQEPLGSARADTSAMFYLVPIHHQGLRILEPSQRREVGTVSLVVTPVGPDGAPFADMDLVESIRAGSRADFAVSLADLDLHAGFHGIKLILVNVTIANKILQFSLTPATARPQTAPLHLAWARLAEPMCQAILAGKAALDVSIVKEAKGSAAAPPAAAAVATTTPATPAAPKSAFEANLMSQQEMASRLAAKPTSGDHIKPAKPANRRVSAVHDVDAPPAAVEIAVTPMPGQERRSKNPALSWVGSGAAPTIAGLEYGLPVHHRVDMMSGTSRVGQLMLSIAPVGPYLSVEISQVSLEVPRGVMAFTVVLKLGKTVEKVVFVTGRGANPAAQDPVITEGLASLAPAGKAPALQEAVEGIFWTETADLDLAYVRTAKPLVEAWRVGAVEVGKEVVASSLRPDIYAAFAKTRDERLERERKQREEREEKEKVEREEKEKVEKEREEKEKAEKEKEERERKEKEVWEWK
jgi:hypothetical protein